MTRDGFCGVCIPFRFDLHRFLRCAVYNRKKAIPKKDGFFLIAGDKALHSFAPKGQHHWREAQHHSCRWHDIIDTAGATSCCADGANLNFAPGGGREEEEQGDDLKTADQHFKREDKLGKDGKA